MFENLKLRYAMMVAFFETWKAENKGEINMNAIIALAIGLIVAAAILPSAIVDITNTTNWTGAPTAVLTLVPVIGIVAVVAILLMVLNR